jgi:hypothetical protein
VDVAVFSGQPGQLVYATTNARRLLDDGGASGNTGAAGSLADRAPQEAPAGMGAQLVFQRIVIAASPNPAQPISGRPPAAAAFLWYTRPASGGILSVMWPAVELGTFALALAIVVWLVGLPVLRPLAAMSQAAEGVAALRGRLLRKEGSRK